jgi:hypothetical protein
MSKRCERSCSTGLGSHPNIGMSGTLGCSGDNPGAARSKNWPARGQRHMVFRFHPNGHAMARSEVPRGYNLIACR